jgi:trk system potassium uptake protein
MLSLEHLSAVELARNIRTPDAVIVENFARGAIEVQDIVVAPQARTIGRALKELQLPKGVRIGSIYRDGKLWIAGADDRIQAEDQITLIGHRERVDEVLDRFRTGPSPRKAVVIAGGGETGNHLARILQGERFSVVLMEHSRARCEQLAARLPRVTVVQADATRRSVLEEERAGSADAFVACMGNDENNIMAGVGAREIGAKKILAIVGRPDYADVVGRLGIDVAVSPRDVMGRQVLSLLQPGPIMARMPLPGGNIGVFEIELWAGAPAAEQVLANLPLPPQCLIAALMRADYTIVPGADDRLRTGDTIIALIAENQLDEALQQFTPR